jgi:GAF domain-containing protein
MKKVPTDDAALPELTRELENVRDRQKAVAEVLHALSRPGIRLQPILDRIVEAATGLCRAESGLIFRAEGELFHVGAGFGVDSERLAYEREHPSRAGPESCTGRVVMTRKPVHIPDVRADPDYTFPMPEVGSHRTLLGVPVLVDDELVGVIGLARTAVQPFDEGEIDLVTTFADQCAVAIVSAELFETVERQKTELARFLSPEVAALVSSDEGAQLLGHRAYITVVHFDLRGFTSFAESAEPEELINVVQEYHCAAGELVLAHGGTLETSRATG